MTGEQTPVLSQAVTSLKGVGSRVAERLDRLGIRCVRDLLFHLPLRYQDRTSLTPIGALRVYSEALVEGVVELTQVQYGRRRALLSRISDGTGALTLRFFHFSRAQQANLGCGTRVRCYGEVRPGPSTLEIIHPEYTRLVASESQGVDDRLTPVYPTTQGLHQGSIRRLTDQALEWLEKLERRDPSLADCLPAVTDPPMAPLSECIRFVHRPPAGADTRALMDGRHPAQTRLAFDELLAHHLSLRQRRAEFVNLRSPRLGNQGKLTEMFIRSLAYDLTGAQRRAAREIVEDLRQSKPMLRLLQGDVGSGKTVVAALAALAAVESGYQVALMAPTELLAEQHLRSFRAWLQPLEIPLRWLSGKLTRTERRLTLEQIAEDGASLIIGTHALFQEDVVYRRLGLVIVDEQHRFGVHQRLQLRDKGSAANQVPHQLVMTATPIPRTLAMTAYADLDTSIIDELPPGRKPVSTSVIPDSRREEIVQRILAARREHRQIYWVCTLIEESEALQCQAATDTAAELSESLNDVRVGLVHGRMKPREKDAVMHCFLDGEIDLLVATTVIEVGVDVPKASLMVIENAERLGLSQLHQLRGRIGRGSQKSDCILLYHAPLSEHAKERLSIMRETTDGFAIAERDLELRGPGELLGTRQAGLLQFRIADLRRDAGLMDEVVRVADILLQESTGHAEIIVNRWLGNALGYVDA